MPVSIKSVRFRVTIYYELGRRWEAIIQFSFCNNEDVNVTCNDCY